MATALEILYEKEKRGILNDRDSAVLTQARERGLAEVKQEPHGADISPIGIDSSYGKPNAAKMMRSKEYQADPSIASQFHGFPAEKWPKEWVDIDPNVEKALNAGVNIRKGSKAGRFTASFSAPTATNLKKLSDVLTEEYGTEVPVRFGPATNSFEYLDPEPDPQTGKRRWTTMDAWMGTPGQTRGGRFTERMTELGRDIQDVGGDVLVVGGDIAGTFAGGAGAAAVTKSPAGMILGETAGSYSGTFAGEYARLQIGEWIGINEDMSKSDKAKFAHDKAKWAAGATVGFGAALQLGKKVKNFLDGNTFTDEAAEVAGLTSIEAKQVTDEVNKMTVTGKYKPLTSKATDDPIGLANEQGLRRERDYVLAFKKRDLENQEALSEAFDNISKTQSDVGIKQVQREFSSVNEARYALAEKTMKQNVKNLEESLDNLPAISPDSVGRGARAAIDAKRKQFDQFTKEAYGHYKKLAGYNVKTERSQIKIPIGKETQLLMKKLQTIKEGAILTMTRESRSNIFAVPGRAKAVEKALIADGKQYYDLVDYQVAISDLKTAIRNVDKNYTTSNIKIGDLKRAVKALTKDRDIWLARNNRDDILFAIRGADDMYRQGKDILDRSIAGTLMIKDKGVYRFRDTEVFNKAFVKGPSGREVSEEMQRVFHGQPEAISEWRRGILGKYKESVSPDGGKPIKRLHDKFIKDYRASMEPWFTKSEMNQIHDIGGLIKVSERHEVHLKAIKTGLSKTFRKRVEKLNKEELLPFFYGSKAKSPSRIRQAKTMLKSKPVLWDGLQTDIRKTFRDNIFDSNGKLNYKQFIKEFDANKKVLSELDGGKEYIKGLETIENAMKIELRKGRPLARAENEAIVEQALRAAFFPPLSKLGRGFTAGLKVRRKAMHNAIFRAIMEPESIADLAKLRHLNPKSRQYFEIMGSLGMLESLDNEPEDFIEENE